MPKQEITTEEFDEMLETVVDDLTGGELLAIPGVYEVLSEHFNNEVIERIESRRR